MSAVLAPPQLPSQLVLSALAMLLTASCTSLGASPRPSSSSRMSASSCGTPISFQYQLGLTKRPCSQKASAPLAEASSVLALALGLSGARKATAKDRSRARWVVAAHVPRVWSL